MASTTTPWALLRRVSPNLDCCSLQFQQRAPIDAVLAQRQHDGYEEVLRELGIDVSVLPELPEFPDCCFVEDTAVILNGSAVVCRIGTESRRGEETAIRNFLQVKGYRIVEMPAPATADGGDVLIVGSDIFIGRSARTNKAGAQIIADTAIAEGLAPRFIDVGSALHLKSICTYVGSDVLVCIRDRLGAGISALDGFRVIEPPANEGVAANVLRVANHVLVPTGCEETAAAIERAGFTVVPVNIGELHKAEAGLTCLSILGTR